MVTNSTNMYTHNHCLRCNLGSNKFRFAKNMSTQQSDEPIRTRSRSRRSRTREPTYSRSRSKRRQLRSEPVSLSSEPEGEEYAESEMDFADEHTSKQSRRGRSRRSERQRTRRRTPTPIRARRADSRRRSRGRSIPLRKRKRSRARSRSPMERSRSPREDASESPNRSHVRQKIAVVPAGATVRMSSPPKGGNKPALRRKHKESDNKTKAVQFQKNTGPTLPPWQKHEVQKWHPQDDEWPNGQQWQRHHDQWHENKPWGTPSPTQTRAPVETPQATPETTKPIN